MTALPQSNCSIYPYAVISIFQKLKAGFGQAFPVIARKRIYAIRSDPCIVMGKMRNNVLNEEGVCPKCGYRNK